MSFGWLGTFRQGQWLGLRKFVLNERKSVDSVIEAINAELNRIGDVIVTYGKETVDSPQVGGGTVQTEIVTEKRLMIFVSRNSSLEKLFQAYVAAGGSPLDISMFLKPDKTAFKDGAGIDQDTEETSDNLTGLTRIYPHDGVVAPKTPAVFNPTGGVYEGGFLTWGKYPWQYTQERLQDGDINAPLASRVDHARRWCSQAIAEKRHNLEAKIIKLMDLREQLELERDQVLVQATAGSTLRSVVQPDQDTFHPDFHVASIVTDIDRIFFREVTDGGVNPAEPSRNIFAFDTLRRDTSEEDNTEL